MKKRVIVISLGGSLIIPDKVDYLFLSKFKKTILENSRKYKFVIVCGGGNIARKYIQALQSIGKSEKFQNFSGISATRMNARFINYFFGIDPEKGIPHKLIEVEKLIKNQNIVVCGGLEYHPNQTSDSTSARIANKLNAEFINLTNVQGLHDKNPLKFKNAKFIPNISWKDFDKMANKASFKPGQHFVLDQTASKIILKNRIKTYILGPDMRQLNNLFKGKKFKGTVIYG